MGEYTCTYVAVDNEADLKKFKFGGVFEEGSVDIFTNELKLYKKSKTTNLMFGMIGNLAQGGGKYDFTLSSRDVASFHCLDRQYRLTLKSGKLFVINLPKKAIGLMEQFLANVNNASASAGASSAAYSAGSSASAYSTASAPTPKAAPKPQPTPAPKAAPKDPAGNLAAQPPKAGKQKSLWLNDIQSASVADVARQIRKHTDYPVNEVNNIIMSAKDHPISIDAYEADLLLKKLAALGCEVSFSKKAAPAPAPKPAPAPAPAPTPAPKAAPAPTPTPKAAPAPKVAPAPTPTPKAAPAPKVAPAPTASDMDTDTIICPKCGEETLRGAFCMNCGAIMNKFCMECGAELPGKAKFCFKCGSKQDI